MLMRMESSPSEVLAESPRPVAGSSAVNVRELGDRIVAEVSKAIIGKEDLVRRAFLVLACNGHLLVEDIPGVGKTTLAKALALTIGGDFRRLQFTPDLLPADVTGASIYDQRTGAFEFRPGPVFGNVVLVDEINRATPKTQSSLLEAMEERQVSSDGVTRPLPRPFFVLATQNNLEMTGTYPLPEAQLDRFFARVGIGYPEREAEAEMLLRQQQSRPIDALSQVATLAELEAAQAAIAGVYVHESLRNYLVDLVRSTRGHSLLTVGASPRGALFLMRGAQAHAALAGSEFVRPDDVKAVAPMILAHRVIARGEVRAKGITNEQVIEQVLETVPAPVADRFA